MPPSNLSYEEKVSDLKNYLTVNGMFELKNKEHEYVPRDTSLNKDSLDWKVYPTNVTENQYGLQELAVDLSDAILMGTSDSIEYMDQLLSRFQLRLNHTHLKLEAYRSCKNGDNNEFMRRWQYADIHNEDYWTKTQSGTVFSPTYCSDVLETSLA